MLAEDTICFLLFYTLLLNLINLWYRQKKGQNYSNPLIFPKLKIYCFANSVDDYHKLQLHIVNENL